MRFYISYNLFVPAHSIVNWSFKKSKKYSDTSYLKTTGELKKSQFLFHKMFAIISYPTLQYVYLRIHVFILCILENLN